MKSANPTKEEMSNGEVLETEDVEVLGHTKVSWHFAMLAVAERLLKEGKTFTSEDLTDIVGMPPGHCNQVGSTVRGIVQKLKLKSHGRVKMRHKSKHSGKLEIWGR